MKTNRKRIRMLLEGVIAVLAVLLPATLLNAQILVISPHPDDDLLTSAGVIYHAVQSGEPVTVVYMTNGDYEGGTQTGLTRQAEAVAGQNYLGVAENDLIFLGYPDGYLNSIFTSYVNPADTMVTGSNQSTTYGNRGLGHMDYHSFRFGSPAHYNRPNIIADLADIIATQLPEHIYVTSEFDSHPDHATTYQMMRLAVLAVHSSNPNYIPVIHKTIVHWYDTAWPNQLDATSYFSALTNLDYFTNLVWANRESLDVPPPMQSNNYATNPKYMAIAMHASQGGATDQILGRFIHKDEIFWAENIVSANQPPVANAGLDQMVKEGQSVRLNGSQSRDPEGTPLSYIWAQVSGTPVQLQNPSVAGPVFTAPTGMHSDEVLVFELVDFDSQFSSAPDHVSIKVQPSGPTYLNIAPLATVSASSEDLPHGQGATKAVDEFIDGAPGDATREWATNAQGVGAWIRLSWSIPYAVDRVVLYDRPNSNDNITSATISFSDGSSITIGPLANNGTTTEYSFAARVITGLTMTVTGVSANTLNAGLAEIQVFGSPANGHQYALTVTPAPSGSGSVSVNPSSSGYYAGQQVTLTATPAAGYTFSGWSGSATGTVNPLAVIVNGDTAVTANFTVIPGSLGVTPTGALNASGTVGGPFTPASVIYSLQNTGNSPITWSASATQSWVGLSLISGTLAPGATTAVTVSINSAAASLPAGTYSDTVRFVNLTNGNGNATRAVGLVVTNPTQQTSILTVEANPLGYGSVSVNPSRSSYSTGEQVTLTAAPAVGYAFSGWSGDATGTVNPLIVTMNHDTVVIANFVVIPGSLGVTPTGALNASGTVGGPFTPASVIYTLQNTGNSPINWSASATQSWVGLSLISGTLAPGATTAVTASINSSAASLPAGTYSDTVNFVNLTNGNGNATRAVSLAITGSQLPTNIAPLASPTASSETPQYSQTAVKAVDGVIDGSPRDYTREWATNGQGAGAWLRLGWSMPYTVNRIVLYDRPNSDDNITSGTISFSDGSSITIGPLANDGTATEYSFAARVITSLTMTVTGVSSRTINVGMAEIQVFGNPGNANQYSLTLTNAPSGSGSVSANPSSSSYYAGQQVTLTAAPAVGYAFSGWSGGATGTVNPLTITMNSDTVVTANFTVVPGTLEVTPPDALNASGLISGPFTPASAVYTLRNTGNSQIDWSASATQSWVGLSLIGGTLAPGATAAVTVSIDSSSAASLSAGTYSDTVSFVNLTNGNGKAARAVSLVITDPAQIPTNVAPLASLTASSETPQYSQTAVKAVDGVIDGSPRDYTREWATNGQGAGAWLRLNWSTPYTVNRIVLYDRPNSDDNITSGTISFSDGSSITIGPLANDGTATEYSFAARVITSLTMTVMGVSSRTLNAGLAEIQVFGSPANGHQYALTVTPAPSAGGSVSVNPSSPGYYAGQQVTLTATPAAGYTFSGWSGSATGTVNPLAVIVNGDTAVTANFTVIPGSLGVTPTGTLNASGTVGGPFTPASVIYSLQNTGNSQINWSASATQSWVGLSLISGTLAPGATTAVTASINSSAASLPAGTYSDTVNFVNLTNGNGNTSRAVSLVVTNPTQQTSILTVEANPLGYGSVSVNPSRSSYSTGEQVTLTAAPAVGYAFSGWSGDATGTVNPLTVTMNHDTVVIANFVVIPGSLGVTPTGALNASGTVGGPFTPASVIYTLQNTGNSPINWSASATQSWVGLSLISGTLAPGATTAVTASINSSAASLPAGTYSDTVNFVNLTNGNGNAARAVSLAITGSQLPTNIAPLASLTASSETPQYSQTAAKAVDGVIDGSPRDYTREWATNGQGAGAWLRLGWSMPYTVNRIVLYDRPNSDDNITSGTISFSDGSSITIGPLANGGTATEYSFAARVVTGLTMTVTGVSSRTLNVGLSEIQVFGNPSNANQYSLTLTNAPSGSGSVSANPSSSSYYAGQQVTLTAAPSVGYAFSGWSGGATGTLNPLTITMNSNTVVTANFTVVPGTLAVTPPDALNASGLISGPFTPASAVYTLRNTGNSQIDWSASVTQSWVGLSLIGGTLAPGATAAVTVSIDSSSAASLSAGTYSDTVSFVNLTNGNGNAARAVSLVITDPAQIPTNVAPLASLTASSETPQYSQTAAKAVDGVIDGSPRDYTREWATNGQGAGAWLRLGWSTPYTVNRIVLYDRPNSDDNITSGTISFSDGSSITIGPLANDGTATEYSFAARVITNLTMTVTGVSSRTLNVGLSEIQVFGTH